MSAHPALLRPEEQLARSTPAQIEEARRSVTAVIAAARRLAPLVPDHGPAEPIWALAGRLAELPGPAAAGAPIDLVAAEAGFRDALTASVEAVRTCRQTLHVSGACWFAAAPGDDGCGEVLRAAHELS